ncbi:hypothetical protein RJ639_036391 [Escallonia herrerae]|uniref:Integrase zinc-binding domain-containing protein n=1 Tax=Escallonia herrerae TaxID=1293975 RepID=A0AA88WR45_9ASTE|nr:hypothetical protein RJ639_036391 [Escallonia herrerae]
MDPIIQYLVSGTLPSERSEARNLRAKSARFALVDGVRYKKSFSLPYLKCLSLKEADYALREVHEGICGQHLGGRNLAHKILRQGYYWPGMQKDAISFIRRVGDLVLRKLEVSNPKAAIRKLSPNWEGPYKVSKVLRPCAYSLETLSGEAIPQMWNAKNLGQ